MSSWSAGATVAHSFRHFWRGRPPFSVCWRGCLGLEVVACSVHGYNRLLAELDGAVNLQDPRARVTVGRWAQQLALDLFGLALVARLAASLIATLTRRQPRLNPVQVLLCGYLLLAFGSAAGSWCA